MCSRPVVLLLLTVAAVLAAPARADRPVEKRDKADYVISGMVSAVYTRDTEGYREYIVELKIEEVERGVDLKRGDVFRAFCYQRKAGKGGLKYDTAGHTAVPQEGRRIKVFVNRGRGNHEGVYPDWFDYLPSTKK